MAEPSTPKRCIKKRGRGSPSGKTPIQDPKRMQDRPPLQSLTAPLRLLAAPRKELDFSGYDQRTQERSPVP